MPAKANEAVVNEKPVAKKLVVKKKAKPGKYVPIDGTKPFKFKITAEHVKNAVRRDACHCVVANAVHDHFGDMFDGLYIGSTIIKIMTGGKAWRYATPEVVKLAIPHFDETGEWGLPEGEYTFNPPSPSAKLGGRKNRWKKHQTNTDGSGRDMFNARALPTRKVKRVDALVVVE
jgi:hypothetical protein